MRRRRRGGRLQVIAPLKGRDNATLSSLFGNDAELPGSPRVVAFVETQLRQGIVLMRVEAGGDHDQFGLKATERRQNVTLESAAEFRPSRTRRKRRVDDVVGNAGLFAHPRPRIEGRLMRRGVEQFRIE